MKNRVKLFTLVLCSVLLLSLVISGGCTSPTKGARAATKTFLTYQKQNQWDKVWEMVHPDSQAAWADRNTFVKEMDKPSSNLIRFTVGKAKTMTSWTHPGTNTSYSDIVEVPVTLIYSTLYGKMERYQMVHTIYIDSNWKFFQYPAK
jgi:hypothetical protein